MIHNRKKAACAQGGLDMVMAQVGAAASLRQRSINDLVGLRENKDKAGDA